MAKMKWRYIDRGECDGYIYLGASMASIGRMKAINSG